MSPKRSPNLSFLRGISTRSKSDYQTWVFVAAAFSLLVITAYSLVNVVEEVLVDRSAVEQVSLPDFSSFQAVAERKAAFFGFLQPFVARANEEILEERARALKLQQRFARIGRLSGGRLEDFNALRDRYKLPPVETVAARDFQALLDRVDTIPSSLALAQAAIESGWGTSRFARQGNNLFGMWCYRPGCGIVPRRRPEGRTYEVAAYESPYQSFSAYIQNLNTNAHYQTLRDIRSSFRDRGQEASGHDLAGGLVRYSQERWTYVDKVRSMISSNRLDG